MGPPRAIEPGPGAEGEPVPSGLLEQVRARTPARILTGRAGASYRTPTYLELRADHAAARDAVMTELDLDADLGTAFVADWGVFEVPTLARTKEEYLLRPERGRSLDPSAKAAIAGLCPAGVDLQIAIADGLSAAAVRVQVPALLPMMADEAARRGWRFGRPFFVRHGRVGVLNDIGGLLDPAVVVLLIGERPGLATAESLSAYMAYRPRAGHDDARRNLISNIHARGVSSAEAAPRIARLAEQMIRLAASGVGVKEEWAPAADMGSGPPPTSLET
jgi:ethanolamine ammonia-lyase small subunit